MLILRILPLWPERKPRLNDGTMESLVKQRAEPGDGC